MKPLVNKGDILDKMFPHSFRLYTEETKIKDPSKPPHLQEMVTVEIEIINSICSVQTSTVSHGDVVDSKYIILCPYFDYVAKGDSSKLKLEVNLNGKTYSVIDDEILAIDSQNLYQVQGINIGTQITVVKTWGSWVW